MNYYERHLGDYAKDTAHLSMVEHGAYTLLLDRYYATEQPIPADQAHRIARARSKDERAAVDAVLAEFFTLCDGVWSNGRAEREIADYKESEPEREHKRENAKERQQRARERRRSIFETLRQHGIVPAYDASMNELQAALSRIPEAQRNAPVTRDATATSPQTPDTKHQVIPSDPDGSGAEAPGGAVDKVDRREEPRVAPSPKDVVFALGVPLLIAASVPEKNARSFLAMQCKSHGDQAVADALEACSRERPVEPITWLQALLKPNATKSASRHNGFASKDYREGVTEDGSLT